MATKKLIKVDFGTAIKELPITCNIDQTINPNFAFCVVKNDDPKDGKYYTVLKSLGKRLNGHGHTTLKEAKNALEALPQSYKEILKHGTFDYPVLNP